MSRKLLARPFVAQFITSLLALSFPLTLLAQTPPVRPTPPQSQQPRPVQNPAQNPSQTSPQTVPEQPSDSTQDPDNVVRITTQLVQIDAVVTDGKGNHVENLTQDDFTLTVDGKKQTLTYFRSIKHPEARKLEDAPKASKESKNALPPPNLPSKPIAPENVKRTIAFVVDDLGLSPTSIYYAREAIRKFVREQMREGDLVGIIRTGRGGGALQQFTADKRVLYAAIEKLNWNALSRDMIPRFGSNDPADTQTEEMRAAQARLDDFRETVFTVGTLGALNFVIRGLRELPGRKMAILISDGFRLFGRDRDNTLALDNVRRLVDLANRSSVVVYSVDAKGLQTLMPDASVSGVPKAEDYTRVAQENFDSQEGLTFLARETGGLAFLNNNDLNFGIRQALDDGRSYYLLGFDPENEKFDRKYHSIKLKVTRPGLRVRTRAGFIGRPDVERRQELAAMAGPQARDRQILGALFSPFGARELSLQMTSFFFNAEREGSFVRSLYHIDPDKLNFKDDPQRPGLKVLKLEIVSFTFNEAGAIIDQHGRAFTLSFDQEQFRSLMSNGIVYTDDFLLKKPGAYQFRTVLRDPETGRLGSASQFIQVPDLAKKHLALSGLVVAAASEQKADGAATPEPIDVNSTPAVRRFPRDTAIDYGSAVYNALLDPAGKPNLTVQVEIYHDGKPIYQSPSRPLESTLANGRTDCAGRLTLKGLPPGDYALHLVVTDTLAKSKYARADQWMDFGIR